MLRLYANGTSPCPFRTLPYGQPGVECRGHTRPGAKNAGMRRDHAHTCVFLPLVLLQIETLQQELVAAGQSLGAGVQLLLLLAK